MKNSEKNFFEVYFLVFNTVSIAFKRCAHKPHKYKHNPNVPFATVIYILCGTGQMENELINATLWYCGALNENEEISNDDEMQNVINGENSTVDEMITQGRRNHCVNVAFSLRQGRRFIHRMRF